MKEVWPDAVVEENNLNQNISALRRSLGDSRQESQYIATVPGFGYRFVAGVKRLPLSKVAATMDESPQSSVIVDPRIDQHKDKQIEESNSMAVSPQAENTAATIAQRVDSSERAESLLASVPSSGESFIAFLKRHKKIAVLILVLTLNGLAGIAFWIYEIVGPSRTEIPANEIDITPLTRTGTIGFRTVHLMASG